MDTKRLLADLSVVIARAPIRPESAPEMKGLINGLESLIQAAEKKLDRVTGTADERETRALLLDLCEMKARACDKLDEIAPHPTRKG